MQTILIVEDNPSHMELAATLLGKFGYAVLKAGDAEEGLRLVRERHPDLVLMDVNLPGTDGLTATRQLKDDPATRDIPVVVQTSFVSEHPEREILAAGAAGFIAKPYHYKEFLSAVQAALPR